MQVLGDRIGHIPNKKMERYLTFYATINNCEMWNRKFNFSSCTVHQKHGTSGKISLANDGKS